MVHLFSVVFHAAASLVAPCQPNKASVPQVPLLDQPWNSEFMPFNLGFTVECPGTKLPCCSPSMEQWMGEKDSLVISETADNRKFNLCLNDFLNFKSLAIFEKCCKNYENLLEFLKVG